MKSNIQAYLPSTIKRLRKLAKLGISVTTIRTEAQKAADMERFSYDAGGGGLQPRKHKKKSA